MGGERLTLAAVPVMHGESRAEHVRMLIEHTLSLGVMPKILLLDGAYNSAEVINYLNSTSMRYIIRIAAPIDGISGMGTISSTGHEVIGGGKKSRPRSG